jgi:hypothetical protein
VAFL